MKQDTPPGNHTLQCPLLASHGSSEDAPPVAPTLPSNQMGAYPTIAPYTVHPTSHPCYIQNPSPGFVTHQSVPRASLPAAMVPGNHIGPSNPLIQFMSGAKRKAECLGTSGHTSLAQDVSSVRGWGPLYAQCAPTQWLDQGSYGFWQPTDTLAATLPCRAPALLPASSHWSSSDTRRRGTQVQPRHTYRNRKTPWDSRHDIFGGARSAAHLESVRQANPRMARMIAALSERTRQFAVYEWFYSTIDRAFFLRSPFQEALEKLGLEHVQRLTRPEWSAVRSAMGRPRRLSLAFLYRERMLLEEYRSIARRLQDGLLSSPPFGFDYEVPTAFTVGQLVQAYHRPSKLLACASILTANYENGLHRVQFERAELGSEIKSSIQLAADGPQELKIARPRKEERLRAQLCADIAREAERTGQNAGPTGDSLIELVRKLLARKEGILTVLKELNDHVEGVKSSAAKVLAASNLDCPPDLLTFSEVTRLEHIWLFGALHRTNAALQPALERLRNTEGPARCEVPADASLVASREEQNQHERRLYRTCAQVPIDAAIKSVQANAKQLYERYRQMKLEDAVSIVLEGEDVQFLQTCLPRSGQLAEVLESLVALLLILRCCAEERSQQRMTAVDVGQSIETMLQVIAKLCKGVPMTQNEIAQSIGRLRDELLI